MDSIWLAHTSLVVEDCEDAWNESVDANITASADATHYRVGTKSSKLLATAAVGANTKLATEVVNADLSTYTHLMFWVMSTKTVSAGAFQILIDEDAGCASPSESLNLPALTANQWQGVVVACAGAASTRNAIISVGLKSIAGMSEDDAIYIDDIRGCTARQFTFPAAVRGLDYPDDEDLFPQQAVRLLSGSWREVTAVARTRTISIDFGVLTSKTDQVWLQEWLTKSEKWVVGTNDVVEVVWRGEGVFSMPWFDGTSFSRKVALTLAEKTARTADPISWSY